MVERPTASLLNVDAETASRSALTRTLRAAGFAVQEAASAPEALAQALTRPDLILLADLLPESSGREVCRKLEANPVTAAIPVLLRASAPLDSAGRVDALASGADGYLEPNASPAELVAQVQALLRLRQAVRAETETQLGSEIRFRQLVEHAADAFFIYDREGRFLDVNQRACESLGYSREELLSLTVLDVEVNLIFARPADLWKKLVPGKPLTVDALHRRKDGTTFPVEVRLDWFQSGERRLVCALVRDVSERKWAQAQLAFHAQLLANVNDAVVATDSSFILTCWNRAAERLYGWQAEEVLGRPARAVMRTPFAGVEEEELVRILNQSGHFRGEVVQYHKDGSPLPVEVQGMALRDPDGQITGYVSVNRDISDRERTEQVRRALQADLERRVQARTAELGRVNEALRRQLRFTNALADSVGEGVYAVDAAGRLTFANPAAERLLGWPAGELLGRDVSTAIPLQAAVPGAPLTEEHPLQKVMETGEPIREDQVLFRRRDGNTFPGSFTAAAISLDDAIVGAVLAFHDTTDRKRLEAQFRQAQKMDAIGRLAGGVAHDFNNLLTVINGYSEILLRNAGLDKNVRSLIEQIKKAGDRAASLTRQLLAFSRNQVLAPVVLSLNTVVTDLERMLRRLIGEDIQLLTELDPHLGLVKADPGQMEQIVMNLAVNARDAMPRGGTLTLTTYNVDLDEAATQERPEIRPGPYAVLLVRDTGCGMDEQVLAHLFEPFFTTKQPGKGTGLGLATVYGIVKQSGGYIYAGSTLNQGSTFTIYLPRVREMVAARPADPSLLPIRQGTETVLLVEDEQGVRTLAKYALQMHGYHVLEAERGDEALRLCKQHRGPIHLLLTDVVMPSMSGRELADRLAMELPELKVLYMTGSTDDAIVRHGVQSAEVAFLQKPFSFPVLVRKVREVLDQPAHVSG